MSHFEQSFLDLRSELRRKIIRAAQSLGENMLLRPPADVVDELVEAYRLDVPALHRERMTRSAPVEVAGSNTYGSKGTRIEFSVPFDGQEALFDFSPSSAHLMTEFEGKVRDSELVLSITQERLTKESVQAELERQLGRYETELVYLRQDAQGWNEQLRTLVEDRVAARREKLLNDRDVAASLDVLLRRREDAILPVPVTRRRVTIVAHPPAPGERFNPEPELSFQIYEEILGTTRSMGIFMERAPATFSPLAEEGIRDFFLAALNTNFMGDAMGEVFNANGKTDILIRRGERNVFIAECKVWDGEIEFAKTIDQLLRNLGWRDTKCAILLFVHERSVTAIFEKANASIEGHPCRKRALGGGGELESRWTFHWLGDDRRELTLTLQVFPVPTTPPGRTQRRVARGS